MSGPKVDYAELRRQEKKRLEEARKKRQELATKIQKMIDGAKNKSLQARGVCNSDSALRKYGEEISSHYTAAEIKIKSIIREIELGNENFDLSFAESRARAIISAFDEAVVPSLKTIDEVKKSDKRAELLSEQMKKVTVGTKREIELFDMSTPAIPEKPDESPPSMEETISILRKKLEEPELNAVHKESLFRLIEQINAYDGTGKTPQQRAAKTAEMYETAVELCDDITENIQRLMSVYDEYEAAVFGLRIEKRPISSFVSVKEIETETERVSALAAADLYRN